MEVLKADIIDGGSTSHLVDYSWVSVISRTYR